MNFDDLVNKTKKVRAPEFDSRVESKNQKSIKMETLLDQLKKVDNKTRISIRLIQLLYVIMIGVATYYTITTGGSHLKIGLGFIIVAFFLVIIVQQLRFNVYNYSYGNHTMIQYLKDAKSRMRVFTKRTWFVIPIWILIDVGLCFIIAEEFPYQEYVDDLIILIQIVLLGLIALDFYVAYLSWKKDNKSVLIEIDKMIKEIESV